MRILPYHWNHFELEYASNVSHVHHEPETALLKELPLMVDGRYSVDILLHDQLLGLAHVLEGLNLDLGHIGPDFPG